MKPVSCVISYVVDINETIPVIYTYTSVVTKTTTAVVGKPNRLGEKAVLTAVIGIL